MKRLLGAILVALFLSACYGNINKVKDKWGPPAKVEYQEDTIVYYYYFYRGKAIGYDPGNSGGVTFGKTTVGIVVVEIVTDKNGKILNKRKYWKQPNL